MRLTKRQHARAGPVSFTATSTRRCQTTPTLLTWSKGFLLEIFRPHSHDSADSVDRALESSSQGIRAVKISLIALGITAAAQALIVVPTGSVALLSDTIHNFSDALTAIPLWIAFWLGRRVPSRAYTYGYGRAETSQASSSWP